ncbi:hypothetical protein MMAD_21700 [Mycolicibacterium madagascariense]|uniref:Uncharacterized protein n=1 Tax=Mycolicibacterium madagascariense TaxID=212765 RepID=A0A7I7XFB6_9MYCO|nr:hypothetical protein [Mycolicibacterium madagascariense]MCV7015558.1 hypothetical protein [Mycolicibacterium madagascariense]BBZ27875.1 hypothetical protein MMAD_21700 [Mycolicibacterium madagascariense]
MRAGRKHTRRAIAREDVGAALMRLMKAQLTNLDTRSHAEFLADMRAKQAAGKLANPATAALLDRLERAI